MIETKGGARSGRGAMDRGNEGGPRRGTSPAALTALRLPVDGEPPWSPAVARASSGGPYEVRTLDPGTVCPHHGTVGLDQLRRSEVAWQSKARTG
jgi:hypothetical protein